MYLSIPLFGLIPSHLIQNFEPKSCRLLRVNVGSFHSCYCKRADCQSVDHFSFNGHRDMIHKYKQIRKMVISHRYLLYYIYIRLERTTDHGQATGKLYHLPLRVECTLICNLQSRVRTHVVLVIGWYELLGNTTT